MDNCEPMQELIVCTLMKLFESVDVRQKSISGAYSVTASLFELVKAFLMSTLFVVRPTKSLISTLSLSARLEVDGSEASADQLELQSKLSVAATLATLLLATFYLPRTSGFQSISKSIFL